MTHRAPPRENRLDVALKSRRGRIITPHPGFEPGQRQSKQHDRDQPQGDPAPPQTDSWSQLPHALAHGDADQWLNRNSLELSKAQNRSWAPDGRFGAPATTACARAVSAADGKRLKVSK